MRTDITREEFGKEVQRLTAGFAEQVWEEVVEGRGQAERVDEWMRQQGGELLRVVLGKALTARAERLGVDEGCGCGGRVEFRQRRDFGLHTVIAGRDVQVRVQYGQCERCHKGRVPLLKQMGVDPEGYTQALQELSLLAGVIEPYESASEQLLRRFAGVVVSSEKIQSLVKQDGQRASGFLKEAPAEPAAVKQRPEQRSEPVYVEIDGGMVFVDQRWQEAKVGCVFRGEDRVGAKGQRAELTARQAVAVRGQPEALGQLLWPRAELVGTGERPVVVLGDGAPWIWNLAGLFPNRVEILDWFHGDEHISEAARVLYGEGTEKAEHWRGVQLERLANDRVEEVIEGLKFLQSHQRSAAKRKKLEELKNYLSKNQHRMRYKTFREQGYHIGSGAVESAVSHVVQQRMKRVGMRWGAEGADAMLALRSVYRSSGAWEAFWSYRNRVAA